MKIPGFLVPLLTFAVLSAGAARGVTPDELAAYLGISSWHTTVDLPPGSFSVQICEFADGEVKGAELVSLPDLAKHPENGLTILSGSQEGKYRFELVGWSGSHGVPTVTPTLARTILPRLPEKIGEGDFVLFGQPLEGKSVPEPNDLRSYSRGFLLRIKKRS